MDLNKARRTIAYLKLCLGRGQTYLSDFKNIFVFAMGFKIFGFSVEEGVILGTLGVVAFIFIGWLDLHYGIWKVEKEIDTRDINPYFKKLESNLEDSKTQRPEQ